MTTMTHDGYQAVVEFDEDVGLFHGEVIGLRDVITFQGKSVAELKKAFKDSITDYLAFCKARGEAPEKPFSGHFVVRTDSATHRRAALEAKRAGLSLNAWVNDVLASASRDDAMNAGEFVARKGMSKPRKRQLPMAASDWQVRRGVAKR